VPDASNRVTPVLVIGLASTVASAFMTYDPLEPWLTESHWDDHYWHTEAGLVAERLTPALDIHGIRSLILAILERRLGSVTGLRSDRIDAIAAVCWQATHPPNDRPTA
jgi:hypothetical protein